MLVGGIERYLEAFPDGGAFKGKNFVFDERVVHPNSINTGSVVGQCLLCDAPHDDYSQRFRCGHCRLLVLICAQCAERVAGPPPAGGGMLSACIQNCRLGNDTGTAARVDGHMAAEPHPGDSSTDDANCEDSRHELVCRQCMAKRINRQQPAAILQVCCVGCRINVHDTSLP